MQKSSENLCECFRKLIFLVRIALLIFILSCRYNRSAMEIVVDSLVKFMTPSQVSACGFFIKVHNQKNCFAQVSPFYLLFLWTLEIYYLQDYYLSTFISFQIL